MNETEASATLDRRAEAEIRKLTAEAQQAELDVMVPKLPEAMPVENLDVGEHDAPIGVHAAYVALDKIAAEIAKEVPENAKPIWITPDDRTDNYRAMHQLVSQQIERFEMDLENSAKLLEGKIEPSLATGIAAAVSFAASALPLFLSALKSDKVLRGHTIKMSFAPVAASVASHLVKRNAWIDGVSDPRSKPVTERAKLLAKTRDKVGRQLVAYRLTHRLGPEPQVAAATERVQVLKALLAATNRPTDPTVNELIEEVSKAATVIGGANRQAEKHRIVDETVVQILKAIDGFLAQLHVANAIGKTPLTIADACESLSGCHTMVLEASYAGAQSAYEQRALVKDPVQHLGAAVVTFVLLDDAGAVVASGQKQRSFAVSTAVGSNEIKWPEAAAQADS